MVSLHPYRKAVSSYLLVVYEKGYLLQKEVLKWADNMKVNFLSKILTLINNMEYCNFCLIMRIVVYFQNYI